MFRTIASGPTVARVSMVVIGERAILYSVVRCPSCNRRMMDVPGDPDITTRIVDNSHASGRGRVLPCKRCGSWIEVIEE